MSSQENLSEVFNKQIIAEHESEDAEEAFHDLDSALSEFIKIIFGIFFFIFSDLRIKFMILIHYKVIFYRNPKTDLLKENFSDSQNHPSRNYSD